MKITFGNGDARHNYQRDLFYIHVLGEMVYNQTYQRLIDSMEVENTQSVICTRTRLYYS